MSDMSSRRSVVDAIVILVMNKRMSGE